MKQEITQQDFEEIASLPLPWERLGHKRIFMTGATGFIGRYLVKTLCRLNHQMNLNLTLILVHRSGTAPSFADKSIQWIEGSFTEDFLPEWAAPDIIIHAASPSNQMSIFTDPTGTVNCNILATNYLLERAHKYNSCFLFFSSGAVYQAQSKPLAECAAKILAQTNALSVYGNSKLSGELLCGQHPVDCRILRLFSVYGPGESLTSGRCFTNFINQALKTHQIQVNSSGTQVRSYCYVSDFVSSLLYVLLKGESTVYNAGNEDNTYTILELAKQIATVHGDTEVLGPLSTAGLTDYFVPNTQKLRHLGWQPKVDMRTCIRRCLDSY